MTLPSWSGEKRWKPGFKSPEQELRHFLDMGDGVIFTDFPDTVVRALQVQ